MFGGGVHSVSFHYLLFRYVPFRGGLPDALGVAGPVALDAEPRGFVALSLPATQL
jgi:hypothetical protein